MKRPYKSAFLTLCSVIIILSLFIGAPSKVYAVDPLLPTTGFAANARPSVNGRLHVEGTHLVDENGNTVQLHGVSTHGLTWFSKYINYSLFSQISEDWKCNMIRLAMYSDIYCGDQKAESLSLMRRGIDAAIKANTYVIVDWHILTDNNPNQNISDALGFFDLIASEYADVPNIIYEICNEPNGDTGWEDITAYCSKVIPVIRSHDARALIIVGTPDYAGSLEDSVVEPLPFGNVMYVLHFYAATHHEDLMEKLKEAVDSGLPVFISECGISEASGNGKIDYESAEKWFNYLEEQKISFAVWSLSDKDESSALFKPGFDPTKRIEDSDLTELGLWVRDLLRDYDDTPEEIPEEQTSDDTTETVVPAETKPSAIRALFRSSLGERGWNAVYYWEPFALAGFAAMILALIVLFIYKKATASKYKTYDHIGLSDKAFRRRQIPAKLLLLLSSEATFIYFCWRVFFSVPTEAGVLSITANLVLLAIELLDYVESLVLFRNLRGIRQYNVPEIAPEEFPHVDVFVATYNESTELLAKTLNGCVHMEYPDRSKVHIWLCDDNRRPAMRQLAEEMGVGYFDRPDNSGAKAGNLNHAMSLTHAPYVVTFDADMIPKSDFLMKTIPYFVDAEKKNLSLPEKDQVRLGFLQTPQCFYEPDIYQHDLYAENSVPNEQNFFYRTIEPAKTSTNSVIYGGSNTVLARKAIEDIGGFYTESITEDFATGVLIEMAGYVSLAISEPLASGQTPHTFREHIRQRTRWGRGVIMTWRKLRLLRQKSLSLLQKANYWSSVEYWYAPIKNLIYILSPLLFAALAIPVFKCNWLELLVFWLPMFLMQNICLMINSRRTISIKWSGVYGTSVMPFLLLPILKETFGISTSSFNVTDKSKKSSSRKADILAMLPFFLLMALSVAGIVRLMFIFKLAYSINLLILLFWIVRNLYFLALSVFLIIGRDSDGEAVKVTDAEPVTVVPEGSENESFEGVTTLMTEHGLTVFLDDYESIGLGDAVHITIYSGKHKVEVKGKVTGVQISRKQQLTTRTIEIEDFLGGKNEYLELLYDRVPSLPQSIGGDFGFISHIWTNISQRIARNRMRR